MLEMGAVSQPSFSSTKEELRAANSNSDQYGRVSSIKGNFGTRGLPKLLELKDAYFCVPLNKH